MSEASNSNGSAVGGADQRTDPEEELQENKDRLKRLAESDLPVAEDAERALERLNSGE